MRAVYVPLVAALVLEGLCRLGAVPTRHLEVAARVAAADARPRALIVGDSFSLDHEAPVHGQSAMRQVRLALEGRGMQVLNVATSGTGPTRYLADLRTHGRRWRPQLVVLQYFVGNDLTNEARHGPVGRAAWRYLAGSYLFEAATWAWGEHRTLGALARAEALRAARPELPRMVNPLMLEAAQREPEYFAENLRMEGPELAALWRRNRELLVEAKRITEEMGARLLVVVAPAEVQLRAASHAQWAALGYRMDPRFLSEPVPQRRMAELCGEAALECLDLLPAFLPRREERLYLEADTHWNAAGNTLAASEILKALEQRGWIPAT